MERNKTRSFYWDNIKGILILLVVFAHILYQLQHISFGINYVTDTIYMFHMPAFVFVSGYFGKSRHSHGLEAMLKILFLYFVFNSVMGFIYGFTSLLQPLYSYWYLIALVVWRFTVPYVAKFRLALPLLFAVALLTGFFPSVDNTFAAARIIAFAPFYLTGYLLKKEYVDRLLKVTFSKRLFIGLYAFIALTVIGALCYRFFAYSDSDLLMESYLSLRAMFGRIVLWLFAFLSVAVLCMISPDKKIPWLSAIGRNSLWIFLFHRPFTLIISHFLEMLQNYPWLIILLTLISALLLCTVFGRDTFAYYMNRFAVSGAEIFLQKNTHKFTLARVVALLIATGYVILPFTNPSTGMYRYVRNYIHDRKTSEDTVTDTEDTMADNTENSAENKDVIFRVMDNSQKDKFDNAFRITFAGDLILLEDQVKRGYSGNNSYDFSEVFAYAQKHIWSADLAIGVFEGPMAGAKAGYSTSNFDDGKELFLNFPDEFALAVKDAGFDLVTTANNHLLDKEVSGAKRTLDILDKNELAHIGSYRNEKEKKKNHIQLLKYDGLKIAVLAYTYGSNNYETEQLLDKKLSYLTSLATDTEGEAFETMKANVRKDFDEAKKLKPDLIMVLPHMGTQFSNEPDEMQNVWFSYFKELGADIILGDHAHAVQPVQIENIGDKNVFTAYCPGNFANIYRENQGDTSMLIDVYISRTNKKIIGGSIVPLYTQSSVNGNYRALPVYEIMNDNKLRKQLSTDDLDKAEQAHHTVTEIVFGNAIDISSVTDRYYFDNDGFMRQKVTGLEITDEMRYGLLYNSIASASSVCFLGDSVTEGTKNGGIPWYEPLEEHFSGTTFLNFSKGGCTVSYLTKNVDKIPHADLYVIAIGTNDVRYRDKKVCAMTADDFVQEADKLRIKLVSNNPDARFIFIAPWYSTDGDTVSVLSYKEKCEMNTEYSTALKNYCENNNIGFIDANSYLKTILTRYPQNRYLIDYIHPNGNEGVIMYTKAVLKSQ